MQENTAVQETNSVNQEQISGQNVVRVVEKTETVETKRLQEHYNFFGPVTFLYPIPVTAANVNPNLGQNEGWQWI